LLEAALRKEQLNMAVYSTVTPKAAAAVTSRPVGADGAPSHVDDSNVKLTKREIEVLKLVVQGKSSKEVADELFVSKRTVDFHLANIYDKLHVTNRVQAFRRATRLGLIPYEAQFAD
jgi:DNA-binding NarL/FixJ family response regulator